MLELMRMKKEYKEKRMEKYDQKVYWNSVDFLFDETHMLRITMILTGK